MKSKNWLSDILEDFSYTHFLKEHPVMVEGIKKLLIAGEKPDKIRRFCEKAAGDAKLTASMIGHMIDYVNKQIKTDKTSNQ